MKVVLENKDNEISLNVPNEFLKSDFPKLEEVHLLGKILSIGEQAFCGLTCLKNVSMPDTVTCILGDAFWNCKALPNIDLSNNLLYIMVCAFQGTGLKAVSIPESVVCIKINAFDGCPIQSVDICFSDKMFYLVGYMFTGLNLALLFSTSIVDSARFRLVFPDNYPSNPLLKGLYDRYLDKANFEIKLQRDCVQTQEEILPLNDEAVQNINFLFDCMHKYRFGGLKPKQENDVSDKEK